MPTIEATTDAKSNAPRGAGQRVRVLEAFNLTIYEGETLGIVGESGCGKSTLANTLLRLIPATSGEVLYDGENILTIDAAKLRQLRQHD